MERLTARAQALGSTDAKEVTSVRAELALAEEALKKEEAVADALTSCRNKSEEELRRAQQAQEDLR